MANFDALKQSPEDKAIKVPLAGMKFPWLPTVSAAERAEAKGHKLGSILDGLQALQALQNIGEDASVSKAINDLNGGMQALSQLVWYGFLTFDDIDLSAVQQHITQDAISDLPVGEMMGMLFPTEDPEADGEGKPDGPGAP